MTSTEQKIRLIELDTVDSTNNYAMQLIRGESAVNGVAVLAQHQTSGKGQRGKIWKDEAGESLNCSLIIETERYDIKNHFHLIALTVIAIRKVVEATTHHPVHIKWPNDIYIGDRKVGGILIESVTRGKELKQAVIGFGINVNQQLFEEALPNPVSLRQLTGKTYNIKRLAEDCLNIMLKDLLQKTYPEVLSQYNKHLYKLHQTITVKDNDVMITDTLKGVNEYGQLIIGDHTSKTYNPGEVQMILSHPDFSKS